MAPRPSYAPEHCPGLSPRRARAAGSVRHGSCCSPRIATLSGQRAHVLSEMRDRELRIGRPSSLWTVGCRAPRIGARPSMRCSRMRNVGASTCWSAGGSTGSPKKKVFVIYGHDHPSRDQLEAMPARWGLEPLMLDQLPDLGPDGNRSSKRQSRRRTSVSFWRPPAGLIASFE